MLDEDNLAQIEAREAAATGDGWALESAQEAPVVIVSRGEAQSRLHLMRDLEPASTADYEFVASSRRDVRLLIQAHRDGMRPPAEQLELIKTRAEGASPAPWQVFLGSDGGVGGSDVIWVSDLYDERDLYLWVDSNPASNADYVYVAAVRTDIPELLSSLEQST